MRISRVSELEIITDSRPSRLKNTLNFRGGLHREPGIQNRGKERKREDEVEGFRIERKSASIGNPQIELWQAAASRLHPILDQIDPKKGSGSRTQANEFLKNSAVATA